MLRNWQGLVRALIKPCLSSDSNDAHTNCALCRILPHLDFDHQGDSMWTNGVLTCFLGRSTFECLQQDGRSFDSKMFSDQKKLMPLNSLCKGMTELAQCFESASSAGIGLQGHLMLGLCRNSCIYNSKEQNHSVSGSY